MLVRRRALLAVAVVSLLSSGVGTAPAAAVEWSNPKALTEQLGHEDSVLPAVAVAPGGRALAAWLDFEDIVGDPTARYADRPAAGSFGTELDLGPTFDNATSPPAVAVADSGAAVAAWLDEEAGHDVVKAAYRGTSGGFSSAVTISAGDEDARGTDVAITAAGKAIVTWYSCPEILECFAWSSTHGSSGGFAAAQELNDEDDQGTFTPSAAPQLALDAAGNALVTFYSNRPGGPGTISPIEVAAMPAAATAFGAAVDLGEGSSPDIAVGAGLATVVWQRAGNIEAAAQALPGGAFGAPVVVWNAASMSANASNAKVGIDGDGDATVIFEAGTPTAIRVADRPAAGSFTASPPVLASTGNSGEPQLAIDADGDAVATWTGTSGAKLTAESAYRSASSSSFEHHTLSPVNKTSGSTAVAIAADGTATAVWQQSEFFGVVFAAETGATSPPPPPPALGRRGLQPVPGRWRRRQLDLAAGKQAQAGQPQARQEATQVQEGLPQEKGQRQAEVRQGEAEEGKAEGSLRLPGRALLSSSAGDDAAAHRTDPRAR